MKKEIKELIDNSFLEKFADSIISKCLGACIEASGETNSKLRDEGISMAMDKIRALRSSE